VCTVTVCAALGLSRWLKVDDLVSGVWIGALLASLTGWTIKWLQKKRISFLFRKILVTSLYYGGTYWALKATGLIGIAGNCLGGVDKVIWGILAGSLVFAQANWLSRYLHFRLRKVIVPVLELAITSLVFYFLSQK
jgi:fructose-specific phosphotransferase system IIC component